MDETRMKVQEKQHDELAGRVACLEDALGRLYRLLRPAFIRV